MADNNEELKNKVDQMEKEIEKLKKYLEENYRKEKKNHKELKAMQKKQHEDNMRSNTIQNWGIFSSPVIISLALYFIKKWGNGKDDKVDKILKKLEESKK